eukprot:4840701-Amphidinium_carterae.3
MHDAVTFCFFFSIVLPTSFSNLKGVKCMTLMRQEDNSNASCKRYSQCPDVHVPRPQRKGIEPATNETFGAGGVDQ